MVESRWLRWIGPGVIALGAVTLIASTTLGAGRRPWVPRACAGPPGSLASAARQVDPATIADLRRGAWFRLDPVIGDDGALRAQRLAFGNGGDRHAGTVELPRESFVAGPFGRLLLVGSDDGTTSRLAALDVADGCAWEIARETDVIRRATLDPSGDGVYEMRVDRGSRADLGIWLRPADGRSPARRVLDPLGADGRFGRTFSTEFAWDLAGSRLAVQSCGEAACRTRVIAPRGGPVVTVDAPDLGVLVGFAGDRIVTYGACRGLPCPIVSTDLTSGDRRELTPAGGTAVVLATPDGARVVHETAGATGRRLRDVTLDGVDARDVGPVPDGVGLLPAPIQAGSAMRLPPAWVLLAADGRLPADGVGPGPQLRHVPDGSTVPFDEATR